MPLNAVTFLNLRRAASVIALGVVLTLAPQGPAHAEFSAFTQGVAEAAADDPVVAEFYRSRGYQPIWTGQDADDAARRLALLRALDEARFHALPAASYDVETLRVRLSSVPSERELGQLEADMTKLFLRYAHDAHSGVIEPGRIIPDIKRDLKRQDPAVTLAEFAAAPSPDAFMHALPPTTREYVRLLRAKLRLEEIVARGGWGQTVDAGKLEPGDQGPAVIALRDRLVRMGYLAPSPTPVYDRDIERAVQTFQTEHGLTPDGVAGEATLDAVNASAETRLRSVVVALERERWMNYDRGARHVWVNIPDFTAKIIDDGVVTFETRAVVGQNSADRRTPEFSDMMEFMVLNPTWNVPRSIAVKEYLPALQRNPQAAGHLRVIDRAGRVVSRDAVDFTQYTAANFPFDLKQPPSNSNALGLVKFMFPNPWNIYLHDTPAKNLFSREVRAYSHGCIRLNDPFDFAYALLARQTSDPKGEFAQSLKSGRETQLPLATPIPVHLVYRTAFTGPKGELNFRSDIYGRDALIFDALIEAGVVLPGVQG